MEIKEVRANYQLSSKLDTIRLLGIESEPKMVDVIGRDVRHYDLEYNAENKVSH